VISTKYKRTVQFVNLNSVVRVQLINARLIGYEIVIGLVILRNLKIWICTLTVMIIAQRYKKTCECYHKFS